jgi:hypothetical protein
MRIASLRISGANPQYGPAIPKNATYHYYDDGTLRYISDLVKQDPLIGGAFFDRALGYDNVGRVKETYSGSEAASFVNNQLPPSAATGTFRQSFDYDEFDNEKYLRNRYWSQQYTGESITFLNDRNQDGRSYDAEGNETGNGAYRYDAAGRAVTWTPHSIVYDGEGFEVRRNGYFTYIRSSVINGKIIKEIDGDPSNPQNYAPKTNNVYAGTELIAQASEAYETQLHIWYRGVGFIHRDPVTRSSSSSDFSGAYGVSNNLDPLGVDVGFEDPFLGGENSTPQTTATISTVGNGTFDSPECWLDAMLINCDEAYSFIQAGAAVPCPDNHCGPQHGIYENADGKLAGYWAVFNGSGYWLSDGHDSDVLDFNELSDIETKTLLDGLSLNIAPLPKTKKKKQDALPKWLRTYGTLVLRQIANDLEEANRKMPDAVQSSGSILYVFNLNYTLTRDMDFYVGFDSPGIIDLVKDSWKAGKVGHYPHIKNARALPAGFSVTLSKILSVGDTNRALRRSFYGGSSLNGQICTHGGCAGLSYSSGMLGGSVGVGSPTISGGYSNNFLHVNLNPMDYAYDLCRRLGKC